MLSLFVSLYSFAGQGVAAGGGGGNQVPTLNVQSPEMIMITCPDKMEVRCASSYCTAAADSSDEFIRNQLLRDACAELESE